MQIAEQLVSIPNRERDLLRPANIRKWNKPNPDVSIPNRERDLLRLEKPVAGDYDKDQSVSIPNRERDLLRHDV